MSTTSLKLPDELKARLKQVAEARDTSAHAFMLESLQKAVTAAEQQLAFLADAQDAWVEMTESGQAYDASDVHRYISARARGETVERPQPKPWRA